MQTNVLARRVAPVLLILATSFITAIAGETPKGPIPKGVTRVIRGARPDGFKGEILEPQSDVITDEQHAEYRKDMANAVGRVLTLKATPVEALAEVQTREQRIFDRKYARWKRVEVQRLTEWSGP